MKSGHIDSLQFSLFISILNSLYKGVLCVMRRFSSNEKLNSVVAGAFSALSLLVDSKERRIFFALVILCRSIVSLLSSKYWWLGCISKYTLKTWLVQEILVRRRPVLGVDVQLHKIYYVLWTRKYERLIPRILPSILSNDIKWYWSMRNMGLVTQRG